MKKRMIAVISVLTGIALLTGCGKTAETGIAGEDAVKVIKIGACADFEDVSFVNEAGEQDGFEIELLKKIDDMLPQYEFDITLLPWENLLLSLDSGRIDLCTCEWEYTDERAENYLFAEEGFRDYSLYFEGLKGSDLTWEGLAGKVVATVDQADNTTVQIQNYNAEHPGQEIGIDYMGNITSEVALASLDQGRWDATYTTQAGLEKDNREYGDKYAIGDLITHTETYFLYHKDGRQQELHDDVDAALKELKEDGTLNEISEKWFGVPAYFE